MPAPADKFQTIMLIPLVATVLLLAAGQLLFKHAAGSLAFDQPRTFLSWSLLFALFLYALATLSWLFVLTRMPLSVAFPFNALTFLLVPLLAAYFLREPLRVETLVGGVLICAGIVVATRQWT